MTSPLLLPGRPLRTDERPSRFDVGYVTFSGFDPEMARVLAALRAEGLTARPARWDDPDVDWSQFATALVRSPWDYVERYQEFLGWLRRTAMVTRVVNPAPVIEWNLDKRYLRHLSASGVPTVPTLWASADSSPGELVGELRERGWRELVVKPAIGAGGCQILRTTDPYHAAEYACRLTNGGLHALLQPYLDSIDTSGEMSIVYIGGSLSHAVRKSPYLRPEQRRDEPLLPDPAQGTEAAQALLEPQARHVDVAHVALNAVPFERDTLAYARVDLVYGPQGSVLVNEVELVEPLLYLAGTPDAGARLARAVAPP
jgi:hypothetical protein